MTFTFQLRVVLPDTKDGNQDVWAYVSWDGLNRGPTAMVRKLPIDEANPASLARAIGVAAVSMLAHPKSRVVGQCTQPHLEPFKVALTNAWAEVTDERSKYLSREGDADARG